jgi:hypothetical protein
MANGKARSSTNFIVRDMVLVWFRTRAMSCTGATVRVSVRVELQLRLG